MQTHPCYPLTDANRAEYERLNEAKSKLQTTTDPIEREKLIIERGRASQEIRRIGMKTQLLPLNLPKPPDAELARLRANNDQQQAQIKAQAETILQQRISLDQAHKHNIELRKALDALGFHTDIWFPLPEKTILQEMSKEMVI